MRKGTGGRKLCSTLPFFFLPPHHITTTNKKRKHSKMGSGNTKVLDQTDKKVVLVVGGGFGGIEVAKAVEKKTNCALVDRKDYFFHNVGALRLVLGEEIRGK